MIRASRYTPFGLCVVLTGVFVAIAAVQPQASTWAWALAALFAVASVMGVYDLVQPAHSIRRNYPVTGRIRWAAELVRPEIRQYLVESDEDATPFSRSQRSLVYQRAKGEAGERAFGTLLDPYRPGYEFLGHSLAPAPAGDPERFRITIGGPHCARPYTGSVFNVSAMSFGSLSANAIRALNGGARKGGFSHDTGEGSISPYHLEGGGDLVWEVASGYFGCRAADGSFDPERFRRQAALDVVKMIEIKLSQGAKPGHGGLLPAAKVTPEIAATRGIPVGRDCASPARHSAFSTPLELMAFVQQLRDLSGGKPIGLKLCIGLPWEFMGIVKAMLQTGVTPDFIVVDGAEGGTGAAPTEFSDHLGAPMREGLLLVHNTLVGAGLRDQIKIGVAGKIVSAFDIASVLAIGADWANSARGFMFALGCVQSLSCNTNRCPTGVATQDTVRQKALVVSDKAERVYNFHRLTLRALSDMLAATGLQHPSDLRPQHLVRRVSATEIKGFDQLHTFLAPRALVEGGLQEGFYAETWRRASAMQFAAERHAL